MPELKFVKNRRLRRFEDVDTKEKRIEFKRLTTTYPRRNLFGLVVMAGIIVYLLYYLSKV